MFVYTVPDWSAWTLPYWRRQCCCQY